MSFGDRHAPANSHNPFMYPADLSENEVGPSAAHELREYMRDKRCRLRYLAIRKADVDDYECR